jgi:hypothetical protein
VRTDSGVGIKGLHIEGVEDAFSLSGRRIQIVGNIYSSEAILPTFHHRINQSLPRGTRCCVHFQVRRSATPIETTGSLALLFRLPLSLSHPINGQYSIHTPSDAFTNFNLTPRSLLHKFADDPDQTFGAAPSPGASEQGQGLYEIGIMQPPHNLITSAVELNNSSSLAPYETIG